MRNDQEYEVSVEHTPHAIPVLPVVQQFLPEHSELVSVEGGRLLVADIPPVFVPLQDSRDRPALFH